MKTISLTIKKDTPRGEFGYYFYIGQGRGVKVIFAHYWNETDKFKDIFTHRYHSAKTLLKSKAWAAAKLEVKNINEFQNSKMAPACFGMIPVEVKDELGYIYFLPGIIVEHIEGSTLEDAIEFGSLSWYNEYEILLYVINKLIAEVGFVPDDVHGGNVILRNDDPNDPVLIDFSPCIEKCFDPEKELV